MGMTSGGLLRELSFFDFAEIIGENSQDHVLNCS